MFGGAWAMLPDEWILIASELFSHIHLDQRTKLLIMVITSTLHYKYVSMSMRSA